MDAQEFVDDYENVEISLELLISELTTKEMKEEIQYILADYRDKYSDIYEAYQQQLDKEFEEEKKQEEKDYWNSQF